MPKDVTPLLGSSADGKTRDTPRDLPATVPERAGPKKRIDATIAIPFAPPGTESTEGRSGSLPLDSYQPPPEGTIPSGTRREEASVRGAPDERIVPSSATVGSILDQVRRPPADRLEVQARVASGGMGSIDVAVDRALDRRIAIKTLHGHLRPDEAAVRMFLREARLTGLLDHPHIVPVYDLGEREGQLFFAMKLVEGRTLAELASSLPRGVLDTATLYALLDVVAKVCDALAFAHSKGVLHCDVKPANVMVGEFGQVFLMDWGIARLMATEAAPGSERGKDGEPAPARTPEHSKLTDNSIIGTPCYMSPEQARGERRFLDARSDVFLLGATLYELLTHRPPYPGSDRIDTLAMAARGTFPSPRRVAGEVVVPLELERIVLRATARDPADRYPSVAELKEDLVRFMRGGAEFPRRTFAAGEAIIREGEPGDAAYILVEGSCEFRKEMPTGTQSLQTIGPGSVFGEMAILTEGPRMVTVVALEPTTVLVVTSQVLDRELAALKPWMATLLKSLAMRFRDIDAQHRATYAASPSPARLANQLLMHLATWGERPADGSATASWSVVAAEIEAQLGVPPIALFAVVTGYDLGLDIEADRITAPDLAAFRTRVARDLVKR